MNEAARRRIRSISLTGLESVPAKIARAVRVVLAEHLRLGDRFEEAEARWQPPAA